MLTLEVEQTVHALETTRVVQTLLQVLLKCEKKMQKKQGCLKALGEIEKLKLKVRSPIIERATKALTMQ